ncbi:ferritin [Priestia koreensis]|uniref:ferritin n=1 Tax=Priestia koreensis TaxID=284581 RepID=UPI0028F74573|nr:ferritin [Priestia koreensis]
MNEQVQTLVNNLIQIEHVSSTLYLAMSNYMNKLNYRGMGSWLRLQSEEERTHMLKLIDYLVDRGGTVELSSLPAQPSEYGSPLETFQRVLEHEKFVTNSYRQAYEYVNKVNDQQTLIIIQEFLKEQVDEEAQAQTIVDRLRLAQNNAAAIFILDQELGQRKPAGPAGGAGA